MTMSYANSLSICIAGESVKRQQREASRTESRLAYRANAERRKCLFGLSFPAHTFAVTGLAFLHLPVFPV